MTAAANSPPGRTYRPRRERGPGSDDPQSPHQKGTVENTNRRARRWLPREIDIRQLTDADIRAITDRMNATPRKCLGWKTPAEIFAEKMVEVTGRQSYLRNQRKSHFR